MRVLDLIFLPAAGICNGGSLNNFGTNGYYWSAVPYSATNPYYLNFNSSTCRQNNNNNSYNGMTVRPVAVLPVAFANVYRISDFIVPPFLISLRLLFRWVDLGYREDNKIVAFAKKNIGAASTTDAGYYFRWGELNGWKVNNTGTTINSVEQQACVLDGSWANAKNTEMVAANVFANGKWALYNQQVVKDNRRKTK